VNRRIWLVVGALLVGATGLPARGPGDPYGAGGRIAYEGSMISGHPHGYGGWYGYPGLWRGSDEHTGAHGHHGAIQRFGLYATPPGHWRAGYVRPVGFPRPTPWRRHVFEYEEDDPWGD
jgi:hypothetical protein